MECPESGCGGSIVAGYCDVCGIAPSSMGTQQLGATQKAPNNSTDTTGRVANTGMTKSGGIRGRLTGWMHRPSNATPDTFPLGKISEAWYYEMESNAALYSVRPQMI